MKRLFVVCLILLCGINTYAQKEAYNWFYGSGQGITWNQTQTFEGIPIDNPSARVPLEGIPTRYESTAVRPQMYPMSTREGVFSMSDSNGNLMFYSSGSTIYNANHVTMKNATGLEGHTSSAQSGIVLPFPRKNNNYIVVSIGTKFGGGFAYSIIDMQKEGGLGELVEKNRPFTLPAGSIKSNFVESVMATKHANGVDYWIVAVERTGIIGTSKMVSWLVTANGVSTTPIYSLIPNILTGPRYDAYGYLKISPNGKYFALMLHEKSNIVWGEFNNRTGVFSNMRDYVTVTGSTITNYGGEFSPDGKYLYVSSGAFSSNLVNVFDFNKLLEGNPTILKSYSISSNNFMSGALQLGPDLRMYLSLHPNNTATIRGSLYMFEKPNEPLTTKVYQLPNLSPGTGSGVDGPSGTRVGLPTFPSSFFVEIEGATTICLGEEAIYNIGTNAAKLEVDFDEGDGPQIIDSREELRHSFKKPGGYLIKIFPLDTQGKPLPEEMKTVYTVVYRCYLPVNHNVSNAE